MRERISANLEEGALLRRRMANVAEDIGKGAEMAIETLRRGGKILFMGNGGSAADAQHLAAELVGRYLAERKGLAAIALTTDSSILTAVANDYGYDAIFERQIEALGHAGDLVFGISTSGNSENVYRAMLKAREQNLKTIGLLGKDGGKIKEICDLALTVPSEKTPLIQEIHIAIGHILCGEIERAIYEDPA